MMNYAKRGAALLLALVFCLGLLPPAGAEGIPSPFMMPAGCSSWPKAAPRIPGLKG